MPAQVRRGAARKVAEGAPLTAVLSVMPINWKALVHVDVHAVIFTQECDDHIGAQLQRLADTQASDPVVFLEQVRPLLWSVLSLPCCAAVLHALHARIQLGTNHQRCMIQVEATWEDMCQQMLTIRQVRPQQLPVAVATLRSA